MNAASKSGHIHGHLPGHILCAGRLYCDLIFTGLPRMPTLGEEVFANGLSVAPGGGAFISAAYFSALGHQTSLAAVLPSGPFAAALKPQLAASGIDLTPCTTAHDTLDPQLTVAIASGNERAFLTRRAGPAVPDTFEATLSAGQFRHLHIGEIATVLEQPDIIPMARRAGLTVSLDCSWDDEVLQRTDLHAVIATVDVFLPNESEAEVLGLDETSPREGPLTIIKRGSKGSVALTPNGVVTAPATPVKVLDTTGAGDAFNAGFLDAWLSGLPVEQCLEAGNRCGAEAVARVGGATDLPDLRKHFPERV